MRMKDITGQVFGRLTILSYAGEGKWNCSCRCGKTKAVPNYYFSQINYPTCGKCKVKDTYKLTYKSYDAMLQRCHNPDSPDYPRYGGRGITVCAEWRKDFFNFLSDMGERTLQSLSLDRVDNNLGYYKENCRWATVREQANNRSNTHIFDPNNPIYTPNGYWK